MGGRNFHITLALTGLYLFLPFFTNALEGCDCPGPTKYYDELGCKPMYRIAGSCCPVRYDCIHLQILPVDHCYVDDQTYKQGELIGEATNDPCLRYTCLGESGVLTQKHKCETVESIGYSENCYEKKTPFDCCPKLKVCSDNIEDRPTCKVGGKTYKDGESFWPWEGSPLHCICGEGYTGENVEPFCKKMKPSHCENVIFRMKEIRMNCVPVYSHDESLQKSCNRGLHCQTENDVVIPIQPPLDSILPEDPDMMCKFGNLTMRIGDVIGSKIPKEPCMTCICEIPPVPTCRLCTPRD